MSSGPCVGYLFVTVIKCHKQKQLIERRMHLSTQLLRNKRPPCWQGKAARAGNSETTSPAQAESTKSKLEVQCGWIFSKPTPETYFLQQDTPPKHPQTIPPPGVWVFKGLSLCGDFSFKSLQPPMMVLVSWEEGETRAFSPSTIPVCTKKVATWKPRTRL